LFSNTSFYHFPQYGYNNIQYGNNNNIIILLYRCFLADVLLSVEKAQVCIGVNCCAVDDIKHTPLRIDALLNPFSLTPKRVVVGIGILYGVIEESGGVRVLLAVKDSCTRKVLAFAILNSSYGSLIDSLRFVRYCNSTQIPVGSESKKENNAAGCNTLLPSHIKLPIYILYCPPYGHGTTFGVRESGGENQSHGT